jgi:hypothetical protein
MTVKALTGGSFLRRSSVSCEVRTEYLYRIYMNIGLQTDKLKTEFKPSVLASDRITSHEMEKISQQGTGLFTPLT